METSDSTELEGVRGVGLSQLEQSWQSLELNEAQIENEHECYRFSMRPRREVVVNETFRELVSYYTPSPGGTSKP